MKSEAAAAFCFEESAAARLQFGQYPQIGDAFFQTAQVSPVNQHPGKKGICAHPHQEYGEDMIECPNYPILMPEYLATPPSYGIPSLKPSQTPLFFEQNSGYGHNQANQMTGYFMPLPLRQAVSQDINPSLPNSISNSFPIASSISGNDGMLPALATHLDRLNFLRCNENGQGPSSNSGFNGLSGSEKVSVPTPSLPLPNSEESMSSSNVSCYYSQPQPMSQQQTGGSSHYGLMYSGQNQDVYSNVQSNYGLSELSSKS